MTLSSIIVKSLRKALFPGAYGLIGLLLIGGSSAGAQTGDGQSPSSDTIKQLLERLTAAEAHIQQLEAQVANQNAPHAAQALSGQTAPAATALAEASAPQSGQPGSISAASVAPAETAAPPAPELPVAEEEAHQHMMAIPGGPGP